jgi:hypothetical protein
LPDIVVWTVNIKVSLLVANESFNATSADQDQMAQILVCMLLSKYFENLHKSDEWSFRDIRWTSPLLILNIVRVSKYMINVIQLVEIQ